MAMKQQREKPLNSSFLSDMIITRVCSASAIHSPAGSTGERRNRPHWAILYKYEGETVYTASGRQILSDACHPVILPRGSNYEWLCRRAGHYFSIEFDSELTFGDPIPFTIKNSERFYRLCRELECKRNGKKPLLAIESVRDVYSILITLLQSEQEAYQPSQKQQKLVPVMEYIAKNYAGKLTIAELAGAAGMSPVYFRKLFVNIMGIPPIAYVSQLRIRKAKEMLKSDFGTLSDIARSLGYASLYDFSRDFKKHTGVAPSKYERESPPKNRAESHEMY